MHIKVDAIPKKNIHFTSAAAAIPIVMAAKYTVNSKGDLTGFLNLTIESAPTIPSDNAIFPEIIEVITYVITGKNNNVAVWERVLIQFWPNNSRIILK